MVLQGQLLPEKVKLVRAQHLDFVEYPKTATPIEFNLEPYPNSIMLNIYWLIKLRSTLKTST
jgi:hypothetical protein